MRPASLKRLISDLQGFLLPASCVLCGKPGVDQRELCADCHADLPRNTSACERCALPLPEPLANRNVCGTCLHDPPVFDIALSLFHYTAPVDHLIKRFKFDGKLHLARLLGGLMAERFERGGANPELIIPVPLHRSRLRERGFNQALELSRPIAGKLGIAVDYQSCVRTRQTSAQSLLPVKERHTNVKGAFSVTRPITARHVAIIDDVMTTGHTLAEVARVLRKSGVERIEVWVLARVSW